MEDAVLIHQSSRHASVPTPATSRPHSGPGGAGRLRNRSVWVSGVAHVTTAGDCKQEGGATPSPDQGPTALAAGAAATRGARSTPGGAGRHRAGLGVWRRGSGDRGSVCPPCDNMRTDWCDWRVHGSHAHLLVSETFCGATSRAPSCPSPPPPSALVVAREVSVPVAHTLPVTTSRHHAPPGTVALPAGPGMTMLTVALVAGHHSPMTPC
jgi:hypothetical protein